MLAVLARTTRAWRRVGLVCVVVAIGLGGHAHADDARIAQAEQLFHEGLAQFNQGHFDDARIKFEASLALVPGIGVRGKLAECYDKLGRTASAQRLYREVALSARQLGDVQRADIAAARADTLESRVARLMIEPGPSVAIPGFAVRRNGKLLEPRLLRTVLVLDPGTHVIVAAAPEHQRWMGSVQLSPGQTTQVSIPALIDDQASTQPRPATPDAMAAVTPDEVDEPRPRSRLGTALLVVGAASVVGGGGYFAVRARSQWNDASAHCDDARVCDPIGSKLAGQARTSANVAGVFTGVGLAAMTTGAILWWRSSRSNYDDSEFEITPVATPDSVGITLFNRF